MFIHWDKVWAQCQQWIIMKKSYWWLSHRWIEWQKNRFYQSAPPIITDDHREYAKMATTTNLATKCVWINSHKSVSQLWCKCYIVANFILGLHWVKELWWLIHHQSPIHSSCVRCLQFLYTLALNTMKNVHITVASTQSRWGENKTVIVNGKHVLSLT